MHLGLTQFSAPLGNQRREPYFVFLITFLIELYFAFQIQTLIFKPYIIF